MKISPLVLAVVIILWSGCTSTKKSKTSIPNYIGQWNCVISLPDGDEDRYIKFNQEGDQVIGLIGGDQGEVQLSDLVIDEEKLSANFEVEGYFVNMAGTFEGNDLKGVLSVDGYEIPYAGTKQQ